MVTVTAVAILIILLIVALKYPPIALILFLTAGLVKGALMIKFKFFGVVDYTVLCAVVVLVAMAYSFVKRAGPLREIISIPMVVYLLLATILFVGVTYTSAPNYGLQKSSRFATLGLIAFLAPIVFADRLKDIKLIIGIFLSVGIILSISTIMAPQASVVKTYETARGAFLESNPLDTATKVGTALIIAFCFAIMAHTSKRMRIISVVAVCIMMVGMIITQSRGPFLGLITTWLVAMFICRRGISKVWRPLVIGTIVIAMMIALIRLPGNVTSRITNLTKSAYHRKQASRTRTDLFVWAVDRFPERPILGHGTGAWAVDRGYGDIRLYPHNIILELLYEQGLVGVVLLGLFLWLIFSRWRRTVRLVELYRLGIEVSAIVYITGLMFLYTLLQAMGAFDLNENRLMFFCAGLVVATFNCVRHTIEEIYAETEVVPQEWHEAEDVFPGTEFLY